MSHDPTRKHFLAKLIGVAASLTVVSKIFAKSAPAESAPAAGRGASSIVLRPETRAIARRAGTV